MQKTWIGVVLSLLFPLAAIAQDEYPRAEIFGGYSYFRSNPEGFNLNGWNASVTGNVNSWFGVEGDFSGHYGSPEVFGIENPFVDVNSHTFMVGPKLSYRSKSVTPFAHFLIGAARAGTGTLGYSVSETALAAAIGGGIDINVSESIAIRAAQADYLMTRFNSYTQIMFNRLGDEQNNFRFSAGIVIKF